MLDNQSDNTTTLQDLIKKVNLKMIAVKTLTESDGRTHWKIDLFRESSHSKLGDPYQGIDYNMGSGLGKKYLSGFWRDVEPNVADVVSCLFMDASCGQESFNDFCINMGYDTDSRKALDTYLKCQEAETNLRKLFKEHYSEFARASNEY